jgi:hypothetical protein
MITVRDARRMEYIRARRTQEPINGQQVERPVVRTIITRHGIERRPWPKPFTLLEPERYFDSVMPSGAWAGRRCFVVASGPSRKGLDLRARLAGELVIAVNRSFEDVDAAVAFTVDSMFLDGAETGVYGEDAARLWNDGLHTKVIMRHRGDAEVPEGVLVIEDNWLDEPNERLEDGLCHTNNSGFSAVQLAVCLGADPIYLLGFDLCPTVTGRQEHAHEPYKWDNKSDAVYRPYLSLFQRHAESLKARARIVNLNPHSAIDCFEFGRLDDIAPLPERPIIIGYYTEGTSYAGLAQGLRQSAHRMGLEHDIRGLPSAGDWLANVNQKAGFVRDMMNEHPDRALVYVDVDARIVRYPALFEAIEGADFAAHTLAHRDGWRELLSGTLWFAPTACAHELVDLWCAECDAHRDRFDQLNLQAAVDRWDGDRVDLPPEYCRIFDNKFQGGEESPVIVHHQASRSFKSEIDRASHATAD